MRKILHTINFDKKSFQPQIVIRIKNDDGTVTELERLPLEATVDWTAKYTAVERERINACNVVLYKHNMNPMTEEECDFMLDPNGAKKRLTELDKELDDPIKLQELSGFRVEKKIIPLK